MEKCVVEIDSAVLKETGEIITIGSPVWLNEPKGSFEITRPKELLKALETVGNTDTKILSYFLRRKNKGNYVTGTQNMIAREMGLHINTVHLAIKKLRRAGVIKKTEGGFMVSPLIMMKGDRRMENWLYGQYNRITDKEAPDYGEEDVGKR